MTILYSPKLILFFLVSENAGRVMLLFYILIAILLQSKVCSSKDLAQKVGPVLVKVKCDSDSKSDNGSGVVIGITKNNKAIILTACHLILENYKDIKEDPDLPLDFYDIIEVRIGSDSTDTGASYVRKIVNNDTTILYSINPDLALLITNASSSVKHVISYNKSDGLKEGDSVTALGFPKHIHTKDLTVTEGQFIRFEEEQEKYLVFDTQVDYGNSGGPLVDKAGRMVGMVVSQEETETDIEDEGLAVPMNLVTEIVDGWLSGVKLKKKYRYKRYRSFLTSPWTYGGGLLAVIFYGGVAKNNDWWPFSPETKRIPLPPDPPK